MGTDWNIRETSLHCAACGREFQEGQDIHSTLLETQTSFERRDHCAACWAAVDPKIVFSQWRTLMPRHETPVGKRVNAQIVLDFFRKLEGEQERQKLCFRYVLGLMLTRKKIMKFGGVIRGEDGEELLLTDARTGVAYRVRDPILNQQEIAGITEEVGKLLNIQFDAPVAPPQVYPPGRAAPAKESST